MAERLNGVVERVTYYNAENGYSVLRLQVPGRADLVTVVGNLPEINPGESLRLEGQWTSHAEYGRQFRAERCEQVLPATVEGIRKYLGSGLVKGVGPVTAARIVQRFGADTLRVLDEEPQRLREALGVGKVRAIAIARAWEEQKAIRQVMLFLQSHGIAAGLAVKIYKAYGDDSLRVVQEEPYRLARDIWGVGFKTADKIARELGLPPDSPARVQAGVAHTLSELADEGHVYAPQGELVQAASQLLAVEPGLVEQAIDALNADEQVRCETLTYPTAPTAEEREASAARVRVREEQAVYLAPFYYGEVGVTRRLRALLEEPASRLAALGPDAWDRTLDLVLNRVADGAALHLSDEQRRAVLMALTSKVSVLTGGPGTGKTVSVRTLIAALEAQHLTYALCAPTGRAAKRLSEATGRPARTVHRLLEFSPQEGFKHHAANPLPYDFLIVDESSMLDLLLTNHLLKAVQPSSHLLFVGDVDQLPSVGAGDVLRDLIASGRASVMQLTHIFRQAADSHIVLNAHRINHGQMPLLNESRDFYFFGAEEPEQAADLVVDIVSRRIPLKFGLDALSDVQVLAPMHRGLAGVGNLNQRLQAALNPPGAGKTERQLGGRAFRVGDRVMQTTNNYSLGTFNGDIGRITAIDLEDQVLRVQMDDQEVVYDWADADELVHAFACSVHKSQGSEYTAVVMPLLTGHFMMLQRNLLYTGVTRAKRLVVLVGMRKALAIAVRNNRSVERHSGLRARLSILGE